MPPGGYFGQALIIDATAGTCQTLPLPEQVLRAYIGGAGLGVWLLHRLGTVGVDPVGPDAPLAFVFSPLVGTPLTTSAKFAVVAKSPLTGMLTDALASSQFAIAGKLTGHDAIVIRGRAPVPSVLLVDGDGVRLADAGHLTGLTAADTDSRLRDELGRHWRVAAIGPAGERGVRYATISHDGRHAGRGGLGAVMGAKNLKAIAVRAATKVATADPDSVLAAARDLRERSFGPATAKYRELGTLANLLAFNAISALPTQNFRAASFEGAGRLGRGARVGRVGRGAWRRGRHAAGRPQQLRVLHDRLRAHLPRRTGQGQEGPRRVRERVRARPHVRGKRPAGGARGQRAL
jgi:aldehyde:ferredoxin oxidoreductase